jgi:signal peptidase II
VRLLLAVAAVVLAADAVSKALVVAELAGRPPVHVVDGVLTLTLTRNAGAAFGIGAGATALFTLIALAVIVVIVRSARRLASGRWAIVLGLLLGGAAGNLADRLFRSPGPLRGHVVDWIQLPHWPVFNVADAAITVGAVAAVLLAARGRRLTDPAPGAAAAPDGDRTEGQHPPSGAETG